MLERLGQVSRASAAPLYVSRAISAVASAGALAVTTRLLGTEQFGAYALVITTAGFVKQIFDARSQDIIAKYLPFAVAAQSRSGVRRLVTISISIELVVTALSVACIVVFGEQIARVILHTAQQRGLITTGALLILANVGSSTSRGILTVKGRFLALGIADAFGALVTLVGIIAVKGVHPTVATFLGIAILAALVATVLVCAMAWVAIRATALRPATEKYELQVRDVLRFAAGANVLGTIRLLQSNGPTLLLGSLLSVKSAGLYYFGLRVAGYLNSALQPLLVVARSRISNGLAVSAALTRDILRKTITLLVLLSAPPCIVLLMGGPGLIGWLFGSAYESSYVITILAVLGMAAGVITTPLGYYALLRGSMLVNNLVYSCATLLQYVSLFTLLHRAGAVSAAAALLVYYVVLSGLLIIYSGLLLRRDSQSVLAEGLV